MTPSMADDNPEIGTSLPPYNEDNSLSQISELTLRNEVTGMSNSQAYSLYTSHFLSTWNVRTYEFAAIIFTAAAYPDTLSAAALRGTVRTLASICFSSMVGRWVDQSPSRLKTLLSTISANRSAVVGASILWYFMVGNSNSASLGLPSMSNADSTSLPILVKDVLFVLILILGIVENLSASGNMLSMERDWVVTVAASEGQAYDLTHLNSVMRRIDLTCKLIAPLLISVIITATNIRIGVIVVGAMSATSWGVESFCARRVWTGNSKLRVLKTVEQEAEPEHSGGSRGLLSSISQGVNRYTRDFKQYFSSTVWIPSLALALLHLSALSYGATFITFLLNIGLSLQFITIARAAGSVVEISSTVVTPVGVQYLGKAKSHGRFKGRDVSRGEDAMGLLQGITEQEGRTEIGLERLGLWGLTWQLVNLIPIVLSLWSLTTTTPPLSHLPPLLIRFLPSPSRTVLAITLFFFLSLSRLGLWIYDLTTQQLTQTLTPPSQRSSFTGVEYAFVSLFELAQHVIAIVLSNPEDFKWIAGMSLCAVGTSTFVYAGWVWRMRGHLVHCSCLKNGGI